MGTYTNLPRVIGHRTGGDPENTVLGMRAALPYTSMIEVDVRFTSDDRMVLGHDGTLDRMTNCTGAIEGKTWAAVLEMQDRFRPPPGSICSENCSVLPRDNLVFLDRAEGPGRRHAVDLGLV